MNYLGDIKKFIFQTKNPGFILTYKIDYSRTDIDYWVPCILKELPNYEYELVIENDSIDELIIEFERMKIDQATASVSRETSRRRL